MSAARDPLAKHVRPRLTEERLADQYAAIEARLPARRRARLFAPIGFALAGAVAALVIVFALRRAPAPSTTLADGTWLESAASGVMPAVTLAEGSRVALGASSRVRLTSTRADAIRIDVERGRVDVRATHVEGRSFVVATKAIEVYVVGTHFHVDASGYVAVDEGRVRVHVIGGGDSFVSAGESIFAGPTNVMMAKRGIDFGDAAPASDAATDDASETDDLDDASDGGVTSAPREPRPARPSARSLLEDAQKALADRRPRDAARLFDAIRKEHRRDPRAGLAAFELGRIRLDALGDPAGAEEAFRDAAALARDGALRDDAEAARVEALDRAGSREACTKARDAYLQRRPHGVHRADVASRCGGT